MPPAWQAKLLGLFAGHLQVLFLPLGCGQRARRACCWVPVVRWLEAQGWLFALGFVECWIAAWVWLASYAALLCLCALGFIGLLPQAGQQLLFDGIKFSLAQRPFLTQSVQAF